MRHDGRARRGAILFEIVVGLAILTIAGTGWITLLAQTRASIAGVRLREARTRAASDLLQRYRLFSESEYDARLGTTRAGRLAINVAAIAPHFYALTALDSNAKTVILATMVYARDSIQ